MTPDFLDFYFRNRRILQSLLTFSMPEHIWCHFLEKKSCYQNFPESCGPPEIRANLNICKQTIFKRPAEHTQCFNMVQSRGSAGTQKPGPRSDHMLTSKYVSFVGLICGCLGYIVYIFPLPPADGHPSVVSHLVFISASLFHHTACLYPLRNVWYVDQQTGCVILPLSSGGRGGGEKQPLCQLHSCNLRHLLFRPSHTKLTSMTFNPCARSGTWIENSQ